MKDEVIQLAISMSPITMGECANHLSDEFKEVHHHVKSEPPPTPASYEVVASTSLGIHAIIASIQSITILLKSFTELSFRLPIV